MIAERESEYEQITGEELPFDHEAKDGILAEALAYLDRNGVGYVQVAGEDRIDEDYDAPEGVFRDLVRGWVVELVGIEREVRA